MLWIIRCFLDKQLRFDRGERVAGSIAHSVGLMVLGAWSVVKHKEDAKSLNGWPMSPRNSIMNWEKPISDSIPLLFFPHCSRAPWKRERILYKGMNITVVFDDGDMDVVKNRDLDDSYDVEVLFRDEAALLEYLLSGDQDILNVMLKNDVEIKKNANHIFRFGFLAKDLERNIVGLGLV